MIPYFKHDKNNNNDENDDDDDDDDDDNNIIIIIIIDTIVAIIITLAHNRENDRSLFAIVIEIWRRLSAWQDYMCRSRQKWHNKEWNHVLKRYASCFEISPDQLPFYEYGFHVIVRELSPENRLISYTF